MQNETTETVNEPSAAGVMVASFTFLNDYKFASHIIEYN